MMKQYLIKINNPEYIDIVIETEHPHTNVDVLKIAIAHHELGRSPERVRSIDADMYKDSIDLKFYKYEVIDIASITVTQDM